MPLSADEFKQAMQNWATGVTVVTACNENGSLQGMTATAFSSVSLEPPQVLICVNQSVGTAEAIRSHQAFAVNILRADQEALSNRFASPVSSEERFEGSPWTKGDLGSPLLDEALASLECRLVESMSAGTHWVFIGEVVQTRLGQGSPLLYYKACYHRVAGV